MASALPCGQETQYGHRLGEVEFLWARNSREFLFSNSVLIHGESAVIVDPSASFTAIETLANSRIVKTVLNTHYHGDHRSLNHLFKGVNFAAHEADALAISDHQEYSRRSDRDQDSYYSRWTMDIFKQFHIIECPVAIKLKDGDVIETGTESIKLIHAPGHTPGHVCLFFKNANLLYTSDIDLTPFGPWYANVVSDLDAFEASLKKVRAIECEWYVTSHGERIFDREKFLEKFDRFAALIPERDNKILDFLAAGPEELVTIASQPIVYRTIALADPLKAYFQLQMVEKHLERLVKNGLVQTLDNGHFARV